MGKRPHSQQPASFASENERHYWHEAQDIAFRAGKSLVYEDGAAWLVSPGDRTLICRPTDPERIWFEIWKVLDEDYPLLSRMWVGGRAITKPGEMEHRRRKAESGE